MRISFSEAELSNVQSALNLLDAPLEAEETAQRRFPWVAVCFCFQQGGELCDGLTGLHQKKRRAFFFLHILGLFVGVVVGLYNSKVVMLFP